MKIFTNKTKNMNILIKYIPLKKKLMEILFLKAKQEI